MLVSDPTHARDRPSPSPPSPTTSRLASCCPATTAPPRSRRLITSNLPLRRRYPRAKTVGRHRRSRAKTASSSSPAQNQPRHPHRRLILSSPATSSPSPATFGRLAARSPSTGKVADFGLAKLSSDKHTHVSTRVMGTFGYLAPEYASSGKLTEKSDVFSYGVMLLELITGRRPVDSSHTFMEDSLVDWARPVLSQALADGNYDDVSDPHLNGNYDPMEMARMIACAAACVRHSARRRPKMSQIVRALEGDVSLEDLNEGMRPGQSMLFSSGSDYDSDLYASNMRIRRAAFASPEYNGDYSGPIAEYGHGRKPSASSSEGAYSDELDPIGNRHRLPAL